jgi:hypothetical protein
MRLKLTNLLLVLLVFSASVVSAQSTAYTIKAGPTLGSQSWNNNLRQNSTLFRWHAALNIETHENEVDQFAAFAQLGYHIKGSAIRFRGGIGIDGTVFGPRTTGMEFQNLSLLLGAKKKHVLGNDRWYYSLGVRGDYTLGYQLDVYAGFKDGVRRFNYGVTVGTGYQWNIQELVGLVLDLSVSPDFSRQIYIPPQFFNNPFTGTREMWQEQNIRNTAIELSIGIRLLRKVEYID